MSFLARLSARLSGPRHSAPLVLPKGLPTAQAPAVARAEEAGEEDETVSPKRPPVARQAENEGEDVSRQAEETAPEDDQVSASRVMARQTLRRQAEEAAEQDVAPLRRQEGEEEESVAALRRQEEDGEEAVAPLRRQSGDEEEGDVAPLRREAAAEEEPDAAPLRRQEAEEESEARPMRATARRDAVPLEDTGQVAPPRSQAELEPDAEPPIEDMAGEREPSELQALHRDMPTGPAPAPLGPAAPGEPSQSRPADGRSAEPIGYANPRLPPIGDGTPFPPTATESIAVEDPRPTVTIDQLDVVIHEPAAPAERTTSPRNRDRAIRARYLRRL